jgi:hypothetical protein
VDRYSFLVRNFHSLLHAGLARRTVILITWPKIGSRLLSANFLPHAYCYLKNPVLVWTHVLADSLIAISYFAISITLGHLGYKGRRDIPFHWMFLAFGPFILGCGGTHLAQLGARDLDSIWSVIIGEGENQRR